MNVCKASPHRPPLDPRLFQIAALASLLAWGVLGLGFDVSAVQIAVTLLAALFAQYLCTRREDVFEPKSALISALSLCLLLRTNHVALAAVAAGIAIGSKFAVRVGGKHVLNPTNVAIVALLAARAPVWVSSGQWGNAAWFAFAIACAGLLVVTRAARADVTLGFLAAWSLLLFARALWLGQRMAVPLHMLGSGALLLFAFFMISDPKTTPNSRAGRLLFAALVAAGAGVVTFVLYRPNGLLWSLALLSPLVPLIDRVLPGAHYQWNRAAARPDPVRTGEIHEALPGPRLAVSRVRVRD
jgi:Na+-transporting NADH:ubiquinone oxidoreductase subunit NqrB